MNDKRHIVNLGTTKTRYVDKRLIPVNISKKLDTSLSIDSGILDAIYTAGMLRIGNEVLNSHGFDICTPKTSPEKKNNRKSLV